MTPASRPGLVIYSDEWLETVGGTVPMPLRPIVRRICEAYQLGDSRDPELLAQIIEEELTNQLGCSVFHRIEPEMHVEGDPYPVWHQPEGILFDHVQGWSYLGKDAAWNPKDVVATSGGEL